MPAQGHAFYTQVAKWSTSVHNTGGWAGTDLSHGMKSLITEVLGAQCTIGGTPLATPTPQYTAITPMCHVFGALLLLNQGPTPDFSFRRVFVHTQLTTIEPKHIPLFLSDATQAVVVLHNRDFYTSVRGREHTKSWSNMLQIHADQGTGHMLAHWNKLGCKRYSTAGVGNEKWAHRPGIWELWLLQGGLADVAWDVNPSSLQSALHNLTRRTTPYSGYDLPPCHARSTASETHKHTARWWRKWNAEVDTRNWLMRVKPINWEAVVKSLYASNMLLLSTRDRKIQRAVRLSDVGVSGDLTTPSKGIYALISSSFPYVGRYGCIHDQRPPFSRLREHYTHAQALQTAFRVPQRRARTPMWHRAPSLPKLLNRHGLGHVTMLRMRNVQENAQALLLEGRMETAVTPTCNSVAAGGALLRDTWETIVNKLSLPPECKTVLLQAHTLAHTSHQSTNVHMVLQFLT